MSNAVWPASCDCTEKHPPNPHISSTSLTFGEFYQPQPLAFICWGSALSSIRSSTPKTCPNRVASAGIKHLNAHCQRPLCSMYMHIPKSPSSLEAWQRCSWSSFTELQRQTLQPPSMESCRRRSRENWRQNCACERICPTHDFSLVATYKKKKRVPRHC